MKVADEVWVATALLHRENPERSSFSRPRFETAPSAYIPVSRCEPA